MRTVRIYGKMVACSPAAFRRRPHLIGRSFSLRWLVGVAELRLSSCLPALGSSSYDADHVLGKAEVVRSILTGSTSTRF